MCFSLNFNEYQSLKSNANKEFTFVGTIPGPLRVHSSVYDVITISDYVDDNTPKELTIYSYSNDNINPKSLTEVIENLITYQLDDFDKFYWSSEKNSAIEHMSSVELKRYRLWSSLKYVIQSHLTSNETINDPCGFKDLSYELIDDKVVISLEKIFKKSNSTLASACIGFVTASVSSDSYSRFMAITEM